MGWFSRKLSPTQETELQQFADNLNALHRACREAIGNFKVHTFDLYHICFRARAEDRELQQAEYLEVVERLTGDGTWETKRARPGLPTDVTVLIEEARQAVESYRDFLAGTQAKLSSHKPKDWYPKKYRSAFDSLTFYCDYIVKVPLKFAIDALQLPGPLQHKLTPGNDKLNLFVSGLGEVYQSHRDIFPKGATCV